MTCIRCKKNQPLPGKTNCQDCKNYKADNSIERYEIKKLQGRCVRCKGESREFIYCRTCRVLIADRKRARYAERGDMRLVEIRCDGHDGAAICTLCDVVTNERQGKIEWFESLSQCIKDGDLESALQTIDAAILMLKRTQGKSAHAGTVPSQRCGENLTPFPRRLKL